MKQPSKAGAGGALPRKMAERRKLCLARDQQDTQHYLCQRDEGHDGGHSWRPIEDLTWLDGRVSLGGEDVTDQLPAVIEQARAEHEAAEAEQPDPPQREERREDAADRRRAEVAASVTDEDRAEMELIGASHPDVLRPGDPPARPPAVAGPPGHSIGDVAANDAIDSVLFDDLDPLLKAERVWLRIATNTALRIAAEFHRHGKVADVGLLMAFRDQAEQLIANRGLGNGGGS